MCLWATASPLGVNIQIQIIALAFRIILVQICASTCHSLAKFWTGCRSSHFLKVPNYYALARDVVFILLHMILLFLFLVPRAALLPQCCQALYPASPARSAGGRWGARLALAKFSRWVWGGGQWTLGMPLGWGGHSSKCGGCGCGKGVAQQRQGWAAQLLSERVGCSLPASVKAGSSSASGVGSRLTVSVFFLVAKLFFSCSPHFQSFYCYLIHIARILC